MVSPVQLRSDVEAVHDQVHVVDVVACLLPYASYHNYQEIIQMNLKNIVSCYKMVLIGLYNIKNNLQCCVHIYYIYSYHPLIDWMMNAVN